MTSNLVSVVSVFAGSGIVAALLLQVGKQLWAKASARFGSLITQVGLLVICIVLAGLAYWLNFLPTNVIVFITGTFATAITMYEVIWKSVIQQAVMGKTTN